MNFRNREDGFTVVEILIVCAIVIVLAGVAVPAFYNYFKRSKTSEAVANLKALYSSAASYYQADHWGQGVKAVGAATTASNNCEVASAAAGWSASSSDKVVDWDKESPSYEALNFHVSEPIFYEYHITAANGNTCGNAASATEVYTFTANGDLDGDGTKSTFELAVGSNAQNELYRAPGFYTVDELE